MKKREIFIQATFPDENDCLNPHFENRERGWKQVIVDLVFKGLLHIGNNPETGIFVMQLTCKPALLTVAEGEALGKAMDWVIREYQHFCKNNQLPEDGMKIRQNAQGKILSIHIGIPSTILYHAFVGILHKTLPVPEGKMQENQMLFNPSPFRIRP